MSASHKVKLTLVAAIDQQRLLGTAGGIPWKLPDDVAHFRALCAGKWLLLGRTTYEEMTGWFKEDQMPLVLTSACGYDPQRGRGVASVPQAMALAKHAGQQELVCIGGAQVFAAALPFATRLVLTYIDHAFPLGSRPVYFPEFSTDEWDVISYIPHPVDERHEYTFAIVEYVRRDGREIK